VLDELETVIITNSTYITQPRRFNPAQAMLLHLFHCGPAFLLIKCALARDKVVHRALTTARSDNEGIVITMVSSQLLPTSQHDRMSERQSDWVPRIAVPNTRDA
jgi:hypothetical protein